MVVAAIDTGATKIAGAAVDSEGNILYKVRYPNTGGCGPAILDTYIRIVEELQQKYEIAAIGIGTGGKLDPTDGRVLYAIDIYKDYVGISIGSRISNRFGLPVAVDNDCRMAVYGEHWVGAAKAYDKVFGIILGTGMGGGFIQKESPVYGTNHSMGEVGHLILYPGGRHCTCGQHGCCEQYLSGTALWRSYNALTKSESLASGYDFFARVDEEDPVALHVMDCFVEDLCSCTASVLNLLAPDAILFGGGLMDTAWRWWDRFTSRCVESISPFFAKTPLLRSNGGNDAALQGAAWLAFKKL